MKHFYLLALSSLLLGACANLPPSRPVSKKPFVTIVSEKTSEPASEKASEKTTAQPITVTELPAAPSANNEIVAQAPPLDEPEEAPRAEQSPYSIQELSRQGNFFRIDMGTAQGLQMHERFQVVDREVGPLAYAEVVALRPLSAFLRVRKMAKLRLPLRVGMEVQRLPQENR